MIDVVKVHPGLGAPDNVFRMIDQDFMVLDGGGEQQLLVVREFVYVGFELVKIFLQILDFLGSEEVKYPS